MLLGLAPAWQNVLLKQACRCVALQGCCRTNTFDGLLFLRLVDEQETGALRTEGEGQDLQEGWDDGEAQQDWPESFRPQDDVQAKDLRARKREAQGGGQAPSPETEVRGGSKSVGQDFLRTARELPWAADAQEILGLPQTEQTQKSPCCPRSHGTDLAEESSPAQHNRCPQRITEHQSLPQEVKGPSGQVQASLPCEGKAANRATLLG